jgi:hypothetical protein
LNTVTIEWTRIVGRFASIAQSTSILPHLNERGFYVLLAGNYDETKNIWTDLEPMYIGQAFDQTLRARITQRHPTYDCVEKYLRRSGKVAGVMVGIIAEASVERITQDFVNDVECCLIYTNQPDCNDNCKNEYKGRPIKITNKGGSYLPVKPVCKCASDSSG